MGWGRCSHTWTFGQAEQAPQATHGHGSWCTRKPMTNTTFFIRGGSPEYHMHGLHQGPKVRPQVHAVRSKKHAKHLCVLHTDHVAMTACAMCTHSTAPGQCMPTMMLGYPSLLSVSCEKPMECNHHAPRASCMHAALTRQPRAHGPCLP